MTLLESIYCRRSIRKFKSDSLSPEELSQIESYAKKIPPFLGDIQTDLYITKTSAEGDSIKGLYKINAPHYIIMYSEKNSFSNLNVGFILEQLSLYLTSIGIGSCYLGVAKPQKQLLKKDTLEFNIILAIGYPDEPLTRAIEHFKRKNITEIANNASSISGVVRLAPSGMNLQPWYIYKKPETVKDTGETYHIYCVNRRLFSHMHMTDMGIAISHIYVYALANNLDINFTNMKHPNISGRKYIISANIQKNEK